ncbi:metabolite traffic protein EboE [Luteolibacter pohnpeiensis]|uniref:Metabolite traffic protein EboE n=1 Tax=Luteolibacter pohnpeiensis TaxID=454153 RepID=A0A934VXW8_9BACT|nr:metabolite traffic protein EboE [Luteolibacter pohnpeiensis]MBK1884288.1 metabolite traffic protein EboE [Luteolibacter pohnpeiensis]
MKISPTCDLSYCTNIHPAETWDATFEALKTHVLSVRDLLRQSGNLAMDAPFAIGLRLSAVAAEELLQGDQLLQFRDWLTATNTYVFTINGFPYGNFHGTRVKEKVFQPDWTDRARLVYTQNLFKILAVISKRGTSASVSTLPGSHKTFHADEHPILAHLIELAEFLDDLSAKHGIDFHLGLEPEPVGHFENTGETLAFFERLHGATPDSEMIRRRIGLNYDACHFALEYDDARPSLDAIRGAGIRISKIHLSSALALNPQDPAAINAIRSFDEPVYFHQSLLREASGHVVRFPDLPDFLTALDSGTVAATDFEEMRVHFHIPLDAEPAAPLRSTRDQAVEVLAWRRDNPDACAHYEIETYTWGVLPTDLQRPVEEQIAGEYRWVLNQCD